MAGSPVILNVTRADNQIVAYLNGIKVYDRRTENGPVLNDSVDLRPALKPGDNVLVVAGINWGGPATFAGNVAVGPFVTPFGGSMPATLNGLVWDETFTIPY